MVKVALGCRREASEPECLLAVLSEFILTFFFVFIGVGAAMTSEKLAGGGDQTIMGQTAVALAHGLMVAVLIASGLHLSGAHFNPAVTLGLAVGGHVTLVRSLLFIVAQMAGAAVACLLLKFVSGGMEIPVHSLSSGIGAFQGLVLEIVLTFSLLFTVYGTIVDPKKMVPKGVGPLFVGFVITANILAGSAFTSASMNPVRSFGPALISWSWSDHWVYWLGPIVGAMLAGVVYENIFAIKNSHEPIPREEQCI